MKHLIWGALMKHCWTLRKHTHIWKHSLMSTQILKQLSGETLQKEITQACTDHLLFWTIFWLTLSLVLGDVKCIGLLICELYLEETVNMILGSTVLHAGVGILPHHVIDRVHDVCHLLDKKQGGNKKPWADNITQDSSHKQGKVWVPLWWCSHLCWDRTD